LVGIEPFEGPDNIVLVVEKPAQVEVTVGSALLAVQSPTWHYMVAFDPDWAHSAEVVPGNLSPD
jgi:hypothetical protein